MRLWQVLCTACNPFSLHLYERLVNGLTMTAEFCAEFYEECSGPDQLDLGEDYCDRHVSLNEDGEDAYWSYPLEIPGELLEFTEYNLGRPGVSPPAYLAHVLRVFSFCQKVFRACG